MRQLPTGVKSSLPRLGLRIPAAVLAGVLLIGLPLTIWGCAMAVMPSGNLGITTGGQQDIASARLTIEGGGVPDPASITVEGFLSEHSIPVEEPEDAGLLYATTSVAWNKDFDAFTPLATIQLGFGTTVDPETFEREPLNIGLVIDQSGSMREAIDDRSGTSKLDAVKISIDRLLGQLDGDDLVSITTFNSLASTRLEAAAGDDIAAIKRALEPVVAEGSTDLARGMRSAYALVKRNSTAGRADRLIVFTDVLLTVRAGTQADELISLMSEYADDGIGATLFGVGTDFGHETADRIAQVRGGNYFFLSDYDRIVTVFDEEFDYLVTPVAYDVMLTVNVPFALDVEGVYGIPASEPLEHTLELLIPTLFLSTRQGGGAVLVRVRPGTLVDLDEDTTIAQIELSFTTAAGETETQPALEAVLPARSKLDDEDRYFETPSTQRAVLLLNTALVLRAACDDAYSNYWYWGGGGDRQRAVTRLTEFLPYFDDLAVGLTDSVSDDSRTLSQERALLEQLLINVGGGL